MHKTDDALVEREPWEVLRSYCSGGLPFHHNEDGWKTIANAVIRATEARVTGEIVRLREFIQNLDCECDSFHSVDCGRCKILRERGDYMESQP